MLRLSGSFARSLLIDEALLSDTSQNHLKRGYGRAYAKKGVFPQGVYSLHVKRQNVTLLTKGTAPHSLKNGDFLFEHDAYLHRWHAETDTTTALGEAFERSRFYAVSPSGNKIAMLIARKQLLMHSDFLTVVDINNSDKRFILDKDYRSGPMVWD